MTRVGNVSSGPSVDEMWGSDPEIAIQIASVKESDNQRMASRAERGAARAEREAAQDKEAEARHSASIARLVGGLTNAASTAAQAVSSGVRAGDLATQANESASAAELRANGHDSELSAIAHEQSAGLAGAHAARDEGYGQGAAAVGQAGSAIVGYIADGYDQAATEQSRRADRAKDRADDAQQAQQDAGARSQRILDRAAQTASDLMHHRDAMIANIRG